MEDLCPVKLAAAETQIKENITDFLLALMSLVSHI
jgi:hypothetical protein